MSPAGGSWSKTDLRPSDQRETRRLFHPLRPKVSLLSDQLSQVYLFSQIPGITVTVYSSSIETTPRPHHYGGGAAETRRA